MIIASAPYFVYKALLQLRVPTLVHICFLPPKYRQYTIIYLGIWRTQPYSHSKVILGTFHTAKKSFRPIAPVRSQVRIKLLARLSPIQRSFSNGFASSAEQCIKVYLFFLYLFQRRRYQQLSQALIEVTGFFLFFS